MDTLRGTFGSGDSAGLDDAYSPEDEGVAARAPAAGTVSVSAIGQDERRMQVRAYNHWASQLEDRMFPLIEDLDPGSLVDFGPYSVLIDFTGGIQDPAVQFLGDRLAAECGALGPIQHLSDVPPRSLLSRITDHYLQILANHAPIGFEAEFVNQRGSSTLYRGILLPYSSDGETIDFLYGVINWKEIADQVAADELLLEIDQALDLDSAMAEDEEEAEELPGRAPDALTTWADSPAAELAGEVSNIASLGLGAYPVNLDKDFPTPHFGNAGEDEDESEDDFARYALEGAFDEDEDEEDDEEDASASYSFASLTKCVEGTGKKAIDPSAFVLQEDEAAEYDAGADYGDVEPGYAAFASEFSVAEPDYAALETTSAAAEEDFADEESEDAADTIPVAAPELGEDADLHDFLAAARELAYAATTTEDRSRCALYAAVSRAYDFSLAAEESPEDYAALIAEAGLTVQDRAPMTPVVKLVFGADYDKTRLTEYAAVLSHAHRLTLERGTLARFLEDYDGGLKAVVKAERRLRRGEAGKEVEVDGAVREALAQALRALEAISLEALDGGGPEFALVLVRRDEVGCVEILGELPEDVAMIERAARKLVG